MTLTADCSVNQQLTSVEDRSTLHLGNAFRHNACQSPVLLHSGRTGGMYIFAMLRTAHEIKFSVVAIICLASISVLSCLYSLHVLLKLCVTITGCGLISKTRSNPTFQLKYYCHGRLVHCHLTKIYCLMKRFNLH